MNYHIGSFNIRDFNIRTIPNSGELYGRDFNKIAEIIEKEDYDVIGIQEVNTPLAVKHLCDKLNVRKNVFREWDYDTSVKAATYRDSRDNEGFGFIWNSKRLHLLDIPNRKNPTFYENAGVTNLIRRPYYARFTARGLRGGTNFELRLVNTHMLFGAANQTAERYKEFEILVKQVLPRICDHQKLPSGNKIMPAYTILLGDYNINLNKDPNSKFKIDQIETTYTGRKRNFKTVQGKNSSLKRNVVEYSSIEDCYANNYDHFSYEDELERRVNISNADRVDVLGKYMKSFERPAEKLQAYREKVSDHAPISIDIDLKWR